MRLRRAALGFIRIMLDGKFATSAFAMRSNSGARNDLLSFFADRLKVYLREQGTRHDLIDAVFALGGQDDLLMIVKRVEALRNSSTPMTARIFSPASSAPPTSSRSRRRRTAAAYDGDVNPQHAHQGRGEDAAPRHQRRRSQCAARPSRRKISKRRCGRSPNCAPPSMPSSTR